MIILWKHIQTYLWNIALTLTKPKETKCWWKIRGQVALYWQIKTGQLMLIYSISVLLSCWKLAVQKFLCRRQMFLPYWEAHFPEKCQYTGWADTGLKFKLHLEACQSPDCQRKYETKYLMLWIFLRTACASWVIWAAVGCIDYFISSFSSSRENNLWCRFS